MKASVLIIDDDYDLAGLIGTALKEAGYRAGHVDNAEEALAMIKRKLPDLLLLDVNLPGISGLKFLGILKQTPGTAGLPVIMVTYKGDETHKLKGFSGGADDYLVKPFSTKELVARVEALLRRIQRGGQVGDKLEIGGISIDCDRHETVVEGKKVDLRPLEFELLELLMRRKGIMLTYSTLIEAVSQGGREMTSGNLYVHVKNLRNKLGPQADRIETIYGLGYKFRDD